MDITVIEVIKAANDTTYGLAAAIFTQNLNRAIQTSRSVRAGTTWINCIHMFHSPVPFGGYKQSGIGRECGEYALEKYVFYFIFFHICNMARSSSH